MIEIEPGLSIPEVPPDFKSGFIAIVGRPNVGKSTLMNTLVGEKLSIVSHKASTTRHRIFGILSGENYQLVYSDTPGLIQPGYELQKAMMHQVSQALEDADIVLAVTDMMRKGVDPELLELLKKVEIPCLLVINKVDKASQEEVVEKMKEWNKALPEVPVVAISAKEAFNHEAVLQFLLEKAPTHPPYYPLDQLTEQSERFFAAEMIREQIFAHLEKEIPYSSTVLIEQFKDQEDMLRIWAQIVVERNSQKAIVLGHGGETIKKMATKARLAMEKFFGKRVFLQTFVKVDPDWKKEKNKLRKWGYEVGE